MTQRMTSLTRARQIMDGHFIERWRTRLPEKVPFTERALEEARSRGFYLGHVPHGSLSGLECSMIEFLDPETTHSLRRTPLFTAVKDAQWCLLQVSDSKMHLSLLGKPVKLLPLRAVVYMAHTFAHWRYEKLWPENALVAGCEPEDGQSLDWLVLGFPGRLTIEGTARSASAPRYSRRIVGLQVPAVF